MEGGNGKNGDGNSKNVGGIDKNELDADQVSSKHSMDLFGVSGLLIFYAVIALIALIVHVKDRMTVCLWRIWRGSLRGADYALHRANSGLSMIGGKRRAPGAAARREADRDFGRSGSDLGFTKGLKRDEGIVDWRGKIARVSWENSANSNSSNNLFSDVTGEERASGTAGTVGTPGEEELQTQSNAHSEIGAETGPSGLELLERALDDAEARPVSPNTSLYIDIVPSPQK